MNKWMNEWILLLQTHDYTLGDATLNNYTSFHDIKTKTKTQLNCLIHHHAHHSDMQSHQKIKISSFALWYCTLCIHWCSSCSICSRHPNYRWKCLLLTASLFLSLLLSRAADHCKADCGYNCDRKFQIVLKIKHIIAFSRQTIKNKNMWN